MLTIDDAQMPGLADLSPERLRAITGAAEVDLLRLRYRPGKRAILHVATGAREERTEGALWFYGGGKARRVARRSGAGSRYDSEALFEAFPQDHRMPQIRRFLERHEVIVPELTVRPASAPPVLLRYRPGLSCTFRCTLDGQMPAYVKLVNDDDPVRLRNANHAMREALAGSGLSVAPVLGIHRELGAIAYASAPGTPLDSALSADGTTAPIQRTIAALKNFWSVSLTPARMMGPGALLARARESVDFVAVTAPSCLPKAKARLQGLEATVPDVPLCAIHGDMKLEHVFLHDGGSTLIDTESVSLGFAGYDLAQLYGRLWQAELDGVLPRTLVEAAAARVRAEAGPAFDWCLGIVALRLAKFHAQRPGPSTAPSIRAIFERLK